MKEVSKEEPSFALAKRNRKLSWVGLDEERPYAYLREVMVSGLMDGICNPDNFGDSNFRRYVLPHCQVNCDNPSDRRIYPVI